MSVEDVSLNHLDDEVFAINVQNCVPELACELIFLSLDLQELGKHLVVAGLFVHFVLGVVAAVVVDVVLHRWLEERSVTLLETHGQGFDGFWLFLLLVIQIARVVGWLRLVES
jgi:uncharacterized membrane protein